MNNYINKKLNSLNLSGLEKLFFALFLLSIPLQTRLTFITPQTYANGHFNEYATFFIYLSDIFLITTFFLYFVNPVRSFKLFALLNNAIRRKPLSLENLEKYKEQTRTSNRVNRLTKIRNFSIKLNSFYTFPQLIPIAFLAGFLLWSFLNTNQAEYQNIALFQSLKLMEVVLLAFYVNNRLLWFGLNKTAALIFLAGTFQAIIGVGQYLTQKSLGLKILGESILAPNLDNVAKIVVDGERIIRAYGTFPHPNVFGAFLILSVFCGIYLLLTIRIRSQIVPSAWVFIKKLFHACPAELARFLEKLFNLKQNPANVSRETFLSILITAGILLQLTTLILTFSRIAWLGSILIIVISAVYSIKMAYLSEKKEIVSRETIYPNVLYPKLFHACPEKLARFLEKVFNLKQNPANVSCLPAVVSVLKRMFNLKHKKQIVSRETILAQAKEGETFLLERDSWVNGLNKIQKYSIITILLGFIIVAGVFWSQVTSRTADTGNKYQQSINYRIFYNDIAIKIIKDRPLIGVGIGNFTLEMKKYSPIPLEWWQYQPAHNIYLLIADELGIIGLILFLAFIFSVLKIAYLSHKTQIVSSAATVKIVSRLPAEAFADKNMAYFKQNNQIVSRETIYSETKASEISCLGYLILSVFIAFLFMGLFDHYFWTLQQGRLIFWLLLGTLLALAKQNNLK